LPSICWDLTESVGWARRSSGLFKGKESIEIMKLTYSYLRIAAVCLLFWGVAAQAAQVSGTVTNKTNGKPAAGDTVVLVDVQAGMAEASHATTDARGHYSLNKPGSGPYLIRVTHQGAAYFIAAPDGSGPGDIPVYDSAAKVDGISIEADVLEIETDNGQLKVNERYFVHNTSSPPTTQYSAHGMEIVLPTEAVVDGAQARRPTGLPTTAKLTPAGAKGHYTFDFPIQPDEGDKDTLFQIAYHLPYGGSFTFRPELPMAADNVAVLMPKGMTFAAAAGAGYQPVPEDPGIQTYVAKSATPGKVLEFTVSGTGSMPREGQGQPAADSGAQQAGNPGGQPGGGIGNPINTPDPMSKYKWWILGGLALLLAAAAAFLLRKPAGDKVTSLFQRYRDAYSVAEGIILLGTVIKVASLVLAAVFIIVAASESRTEGSLVTGAAVAGGLVFGLLGFATGVLVSAQGQIMLAMIDTAVNTSPLVDRSEKAKMIGILDSASSAPTFGDSAILSGLKEELFSLESQKLSGTLSAGEYAEAKAALEVVLKRALKRP
jgi:hypothetical protein